MLIALIGFVVGIVLGSFIDCIAERSLDGRSFWGRSICESCKKPLEVVDLIPVVSFLILGGRCRRCHKKIGSEPLLIELLTGLTVALLFTIFVPATVFEMRWDALVVLGLNLILKLIAVVVLISIFLTDIKTGLIPDRITYPSIVISFIYIIVAGLTKVALFYLSLKNSGLGPYLLPPYSDYFQRNAISIMTPVGISILTGLAIGLFFLLLIIITKGRGMGGGDMKLGVFLGFAFGFPDAVTLLALSFLIGSLFGIGLLLLGKKKFGQTIPFGPFLSIAGIATLLWGQRILDWYLNLRLN